MMTVKRVGQFFFTNKKHDNNDICHLLIYTLIMLHPVLYICEVLPLRSPSLLSCLNIVPVHKMDADGQTCHHRRHSASSIVTHYAQETTAGAGEEAE